MYRNAYQRGMLTVFFSGGAKPLNIWDTHTQDGYITRFLDQDIKSMVLEIGGTNVSTTYMTCPKGSTVLGITMPFLVMIVKNLKKYFTFEVTILDETGTRRRFRVSNFQSTTQILPLCTVMPIGLSDGWNQIQFNLAEFTRRAYKKQYVEVQKLKINANIRLRRIYFAERLLPEDELPPEYKLYFPIPHKSKLKKTAEAKDKENIQAPTPAGLIEEKKAEGLKSEERKVSKTEIVRVGSKASVHSVRKVASKQTSLTRFQGEEVAGSKRASIVSTPAEQPPRAESQISVSEVAIVEDTGEGEVVADGESTLGTPAETAPERDAVETEPITEHTPALLEEPDPGPTQPDEITTEEAPAE
ncbi:unnamed protein product [Chilo suppressalis]|uniref:CFA20 domain-containing protein n=1 Tax=Chilo suppressalis TaxID=168631 RepID=A0ABN8AYB0_CHISP|nr:unnamed protein product [Chilo suppressalis]